MSIEDAKMRMAASDAVLVDQIRAFTARWCPSGYEGERFRNDLTRLLFSAVENRSEARRYGVELYAGAALDQMALRPLAVVMEKSRDKS